MTICISRCAWVSRALAIAACTLACAFASAGTAHAQDASLSVSKDGSPLSTLEMGRVRTMTSAADSFRVTNGGGATTSLNFSLDDNTNFEFGTTPTSLGAGANADVFVTCKPQTPGDRTARVTIEFTPPVSGEITLDVHCYTPALWIDETDPYDFGDQEVGTTSTGDALTVVNDSAGALTVNDITYSGTDCGDFSDGLGVPVVLANMGDSAEIPIAFAPGARGGRGTCTATLDDLDATTDNTVDLLGTGRGAVLALSVNSINFGSQRVGTPAMMSFSIQNTGDPGYDLDIQNIAPTGANAGDFVPNITMATIAAGMSQVVQVTFTPGAPGARAATIMVDANEPTDQDGTVSVSGTGTQALLVPSAASVNFGNVRINGSTFASRTVDLNNPGTNTVTVSSVALTGGQSNQFSIQSGGAPPGFTIAGGGSSTVNMRCDPSTIGAKATTLRVQSDDDGPNPDDVALSCTGVRSYINVSSTGPLNFGNVLIGSTSNIGFTISNLNNANATTLNATLSTPASQFSTTVTTISNLAPGGSQALNVRCTPNSETTFNGTLTISSDDPDVPTINVALTCTGVKPEITKVQPPGSSIDFGDVQVSTTSGARTVQLRNDGSSDLVISAVSRIGTNPTQFGHTNPGALPFTIAPGASANWSVTCSPSSIGSKTATLRFANNDADENPLDVGLVCNGVQAQLNVNPTPVNFGDVRVCENDSVVVTLQNGGGAGMTVNGITLSRSEYSIVAGPTPPFSIGAMASQQITLQFEPIAGGVADGTMTITSTDPNSPRVVDLNATGVVAQMSINASSHDFGDVRIDQAFPGRVFTLTNASTADFTIMSTAFSPASSDFAIEAITPLPVTLSPTQTAQFRVRATPGSLGAKSANVQINTDIPAAPCGMAGINVAVDAVGVVPDMSLNPTTLAYGAHDVQAAPATQNLTIMNTGTAPLEVSDLQLSGLGSARYTVTSNPLPFTVPVSGSAVVQVTYTPVVVTAGDDANLRVVTDAQSGMNIDVVLSGRGIDRDIVPSVMALNFPETYRNPDSPPQLSFQVANNGEATLSISMVTKTGGGETAFTLVDNLEATIGGNSNDTVIVEFDPTSAGDFSATLVIANDDDQRPMVEIGLQGRGRIPNFMPDRGEYDMTQGECDLSQPNPSGCVGVGIPTRLTAAIPEGIRFTNLEPDVFRVRDLRLVDDDGNELDAALFRVVDFQAVDVGPNEVYEIDVEFTAPSPGEYQATLEVYLGNDPDRVQFVTIRATAVEVRLRGGGCDTGDGGGGLALGLMLLAGLGLARRRARVAAALVALALLALPAGAYADRTRNLDLTTFRPMPAVEAEMLSVEGARVGESGAWFVGVFLNHAVNPLNLESPQIVGLEDSLVSARTAFDLGFSYAFADRFEAGLLVPLLSQGGSDSMVVRGVPAASGLSLGDIALHGKASLYQTEPFSLGASTTITVPTSTDGEFAGVDGPTGHVRGIAGLDLAGRVKVLANAGFRLRGAGEFGDLEQGHEMTYGLGVSYRATRQLWAVGEMYGAFGMSGSGSTQGASPLEATLGARYRLNREVSVAGGVGTGILPGVGAADVRGIAFVAYAPNAREIGQIPSGGVIGGGEIVDNGDDDADGIPNSKDKCPSEPEDIDTFEDTDGCPDPDNDGDGLPDSADPCPMEAEDKDGHKDDDGCPDADNDEDGIPDSEDKCPDVPEDKDGYQDRDGCDDPDNDTDGIPDVIDQCALEPETINGKDDDDGCPDAGESLVMVMPDRIEVFEPVTFVGRGDRISKKSHNVLGQVAATLRANRNFLRVRVAVHVHPRGKNDLATTQKRSVAIRKWLTQWGIEPERLEVKGFGSSRPLVPANKRGASKVNDRVEFIILEKQVKK